MERFNRIAGCAVLAAFFLLLAIRDSRAGADFRLERELRILRMQAHFVFYGEEASKEAAASAVEEIARMWSADGQGVAFKSRFGGEEYDLVPEMTFEVVDTARAREIASSNTDPGVQFVRLEKGGGAGDRSFYRIGENAGVFYESDELGASTTATHEFGHGLGLGHPRGDWRTKGQPPVMLPRGSWVDPEFQWDPEAEAGAPGGSVKPHLRKVTAYDVERLRLAERLVFDSEDRASLGAATNAILVAGFASAKGWPFPGWVH
jgi:hypothetical protein